MTLWDLLSAICVLTPFFVGIMKGRCAGVIGIIIGAIWGLAIGIVAMLIARKSGNFVFTRLVQPHERKHPVLAYMSGYLVYLIFLAWICLVSFVVKYSLQYLR